MSLAAKHFDLVLGVDIHFATPPMGPPVPMPYPFVGILFDEADYFPIIGSTVTINGIHRGIAGSTGKSTVKHFLPGFKLVKDPANECEMFMGSKSVTMNGEAASYLGLPTLSCQDVGAFPPPRINPKKGSKLKKTTLVLPTSVVLPIPSGVIVNGPPTISLMGLAFRSGFAALGGLAKGLKAAKKGLTNSKAVKNALDAFKTVRKKAFASMDPGFLKCAILRAEPINSITGEVIFEQLDFELPWRIPLRWIRSYGSQHADRGVCGHGWETPADIRLVKAGPDLFEFHDGTLGATIFHVKDGEACDPMQGRILKVGVDEATVRDAEGIFHHFRLQEGGDSYRIERLSDAAGNAVDFHWNDNGTLKQINESSGIRVLAASDDSGNLTSLTLHHPDCDPRLLVRYRYASYNNLTDVEDAEGRSHRLSYTSDHRLDKHTDRNGLTFYYKYENIGDVQRCVHTWGDGDLYNYRFDYRPEAKETHITDSLGNSTIFRYNDGGLPTEEVDALGNHVYYQYDEHGRTVAVISQTGHRTTFEYDELGNIIKETNPLGHAEQNTYDDLGRLLEITSPRGHKATREWNRQDRLIKETDPCGHSWQYDYSDHGDLITTIDPKGFETRFHYDKHGRLTETMDALDQRTQREYDDLGNLTKITDPRGSITAFDYDIGGKLTRQTKPTGTQERFRYDGEGNLIRFTDGEGRETRYEYFGQGELGKTIFPDGTSVTYHYDTEEQLVAVTNERGKQYRLDRDAAGNVIRTVDFWGSETSYEYDAQGNLTRSVDALKREIIQTNDDAGRPIRRDYSDGQFEEMEYDQDGNLVSIQSKDHTVKRTFDPLGRVVEEWQGDARVGYTFDELGNLQSRESPFGNVVAYEYEALGRLKRVTLNDRQLLQREYALGAASIEETLVSGVVRNKQFDAEYRLSKQTSSFEEQTRRERSFSYDRVDNLTGCNDTKFGERTYRYNQRDNIEQSVIHGREEKYIPLERETGARAGWCNADRSNAVRYEYDAVGNVTSRQVPGEELQHLSWDNHNRMVCAERAGVETRMTYDPLGRRTGKSGENGDTRFVWDGVKVGFESNGEETREYIYEPDGFTPVASVDQDGRVLFFDTDSTGLCHEVSDESGEYVKHIDYDAFGSPDEIAVECPFRFFGQYYDVETGLCSHLCRFYDSVGGGFLSIDPIGLLGGLELYECGANVWGWCDPLGLAKCRVTPLDWNKLVQEEKDALRDALNKLNSGRIPRSMNEHAFSDLDKLLPRKTGSKTKISYSTYYVRKKPGDKTKYGARRVIMGRDKRGNVVNVFYSNNHYGEAGGNIAFLQIK